MTSPVAQVKPEKQSLRLFRAVALIAALAGAVGSVAFTLRAGHRNPSRVLIGLFMIWVLSPFVGLALANLFSKSWSVLTRATLYSVTLLLSLISLAFYGEVALGPPRAKTAFLFLVVPPGSWLLMAAAVSAAALISRARSPQGGGA